MRLTKKQLGILFEALDMLETDYDSRHPEQQEIDLLKSKILKELDK